MKIFKLFIFFTLITVIMSCAFNFGYESSKSLRNTYPHAASGNGIKFYYGVKDGGYVDISIKNVSGMMYSVAELEIEDNTGKVNMYKSFSNVKNLGVRKFSLKVAEKTNYLKIAYKYLPQIEDSFLNPNKSFEQLDEIKGEVTIIIK